MLFLHLFVIIIVTNLSIMCFNLMNFFKWVGENILLTMLLLYSVPLNKSILENNNIRGRYDNWEYAFEDASIEDNKWGRDRWEFADDSCGHLKINLILIFRIRHCQAAQITYSGFYTILLHSEQRPFGLGSCVSYWF